MEDPRDGLNLFGPLDRGKSAGLSVGVIGTSEGIDRYKKWVIEINSPIIDDPIKPNRPPFPGFHTIFECQWILEPSVEISISAIELDALLRTDDKHKRVFNTVNYFAEKIIDASKNESEKIDLWFVVIPEDVVRYCHPESFVPVELRIDTEKTVSAKYAQSTYDWPDLFESINVDSEPYYWEVNFRNQLKAKLLPKMILTQIIRETTMAPQDFIIPKLNRDKRAIINRKSEIAWNICTSIYYKLGGRPWKIANIRNGVCYVGLVFKKDEKHKDPRNACCAAQMFLDSGDGVVFRGAVGPYYNPNKDEFHLKYAEAQKLISLALHTYKEKNQGNPPKELFIHGKVKFNREEWEAFQSVIDKQTNLVGVKITEDRGFKLYRKQDCPVLRGTAYVVNEKMAYLWTNGFTPRIFTYPGREVPLPILIEVCRGNVDIEVVLDDIMALTKLNYNTCIYGDGIPVTLRFADAVGESYRRSIRRNSSPGI